MTRERDPKPKPPLSDAMRSELVALLADDVRRTAELCPEIDLARWKNFG